MSSFRSGRGRGGGPRAGRGGPHNKQTPSAAQPRLQLCRNFASGGHCHHGDRCNFSHVVKLHACVEVSDKNTEAKSGYQGHRHHNNGNSRTKDRHKATSVAVWETNGAVKIFTGSHDGKWRLWNVGTAAPSSSGKDGGTTTLTKEFEHHVGGPVDAVHVAAHFFFCGFEASPVEAPDARAGMVHCWDLNNPGQPPTELMLSPEHAKYAGSGRIRSLWTSEDGTVWSGGTDGVIRQWKFGAAPPQGGGGGGGFALVRTLGGHLGAVTGLTLTKNGVLWSGGMDGTVRLWNVDTGAAAHVIPAAKKEGGTHPQGNGGAAAVGHAGPVTAVLPLDLDAAGAFVISSSLDETVKVWNAANGECVASEKHGQGVTALALTSDLKGNPLLLCGLFYGDIMVRGTVTTPPLCLLLKISYQYLQVGHELGPVNEIRAGPGRTFYAVADDGKLTVWQITGDFGL